MAPAVSFDTFHNIVNGQLRGSAKSYHGLDPTTGDKLWDAPVASKQDVDDAVVAARKAFGPWSKTPFEERVKTLRKFADAVKVHLDDIAELILKENGKPRPFARGEAYNAGGDAFDFYLGLKLPTEIIQESDRECHVHYVPLGVVACILPWNFPFGQATLKALPALLAGNACILKPSPFTPYSALKLVEIAQQVLPPGLLQVLGGDEHLGPWLTTHPDINKISFTGSTATGKKVMQAAAGTLKRVTLELGGNDAAIVCPDVDVQKVATDLVFGSFFNTGQVCTGTKRIYIHEDIYDETLKAMAVAAKKLKVGNGSEEGVIIGPLQNKMQYEKVKHLYEEAEKKHFKAHNGFDIDLKANKGFFLQPKIIDNPPNDAEIVTEEQMGPIVPTQPWKDEAEVIARTNNTSMGLGASVWAKDPAHAARIGEQLEVGSVFINSFPKMAIRLPFSGHKESGIGIEGGPHSLVTYCNQQVIHFFK